jgi:DNA-directed RNA polymerase subunit RPC12/RpoP
VTDHFIKLNCGNCGGALEIHDDMERFACGYCGAEIAVQRRGGTIVLNSVTETTKRVPIGADNTAAELAIARLKEEAESLSKQCESMQSKSIEQKKWGYIMGVSLLLIGFGVVRSGYGLFVGLSVLIAGIFTISSIRRNDKRVRADVRKLQAKIDALNRQIENPACRPS